MLGSELDEPIRVPNQNVGLAIEVEVGDDGGCKEAPNTGNVHMGVPLFPAATTTEPVCPRPLEEVRLRLVL